MLLMSGAVVGSLGILGSALAVLVFALVAVRGRRSIPEQAIYDLTNRVRERNNHPVRYAATHPVDILRRMLRG